MIAYLRFGDIASAASRPDIASAASLRERNLSPIVRSPVRANIGDRCYIIAKLSPNYRQITGMVAQPKIRNYAQYSQYSKLEENL